MKLILTALGVLLLSMAGIYFLMPADQLPAFFPGHNDDVTRLHTKHGIAAGVAGRVRGGGRLWGGREGGRSGHDPARTAGQSSIPPQSWRASSERDHHRERAARRRDADVAPRHEP